MVFIELILLTAADMDIVIKKSLTSSNERQRPLKRDTNTCFGSIADQSESLDPITELKAVILTFRRRQSNSSPISLHKGGNGWNFNILLTYKAKISM